jgi:xylulokinase
VAQAFAGVDRHPDRYPVSAIGLSGQMHGVVVCDAAGRPLRPAVLWSDRRSQALLDGAAAELGPEALARLANPLVAGMAGPSLAALTAGEAALTDRVALALQPKDWLRLQLTGEVATDPSDASATLLWDAVADRWSPEAAAAFGVDERWLAPVAASNEVAGTVTAEAAALFGLPPGVPVATGGADTACALLGAGLVAGELQVTTGTGGQVAHLVDCAPAAVSAPVIHHYRSVDSAAPWYEMAAIQNAGIAVDWAMDLLGLSLAEAGDLVASTPVGSGGVSFLPYLTGERTPHLDTGLAGGWTGLRPGTTTAQLARAVFEGVAFALRDGLDALIFQGRIFEGRTSQSSSEPHVPATALLAGGGSNAQWWRQMLADALGLALVPHDAVDASVRGAALLAWSAIGRPVDPGAAVNRLSPVEPDPEAAAHYTEARRRFQASLPAAVPAS